MYEPEDTLLPDGRTAVYGLYRKKPDIMTGREYVLLAEFATMDEALKSVCIEGIPFAKVITSDNVELLGQD